MYVRKLIYNIILHGLKVCLIICVQGGAQYCLLYLIWPGSKCNVDNVIFNSGPNFSFSLIIFNNSIKNSCLSEDLCTLMYHFVKIIKKLIGSMWLFVTFGKPNRTSHYFRFNFTSNCWYIQVSNLFHRFSFGYVHWNKWCSIVSIALQ